MNISIICVAQAETAYTILQLLLNSLLWAERIEAFMSPHCSWGADLDPESRVYCQQETHTDKRATYTNIEPDSHLTKKLYGRISHNLSKKMHVVDLTELTFYIWKFTFMHLADKAQHSRLLE